MSRIRRNALVTVAALSAATFGLGPLLGASAASTDTACSNGPWSGPGTQTGTVAGCTTRVSQTYTNTDPNGTSQRPRISEDGNWVVFQSAADNLVPNDNHAHGTDVFLVNRADPAGTIRRISQTPTGGDANGNSSFCDVSGDGSYVVFYSTATNLVAGTTTRAGSIFLWSRATGKITEVVHSYTGGETNNYSNRPTISADGKYVTYNSKATNVVNGITHSDEIYVTNTATGATAHVSRTSAGGASNGQNEHAEISSDGSHIAWQSTATNLPGGNGTSQVYASVNPLASGTAASPVLVSVAVSGGGGNQASGRPYLNGTGSVVAWESLANNLVTGDTNGQLDVFLRYMDTGRTIRVSVAYDGSQLTAASQRPSLDYAGDKVAFASNAHNVVKGDTNGQRDVFLRDLTQNRNYLISVSTTGGFGGAPVGSPSAAARPDGRSGGSDLSSRAYLSASGQQVAFISGMSNLVPQDNNASTSLDDVFVRVFGTSTGPVAVPDLVTAQGTNGAAYVYTPTTSGWTSYGGLISGSPAVVPARAPYGMYLVASTPSGMLYSRTATTGWSAAAPSGTSCREPDLTYAASALVVACTGSNSAVYTARFDSTQAGNPYFASFTSLGGAVSAGPAVYANPSPAALVYTGVGAAHDSVGNDLYARTDTTGWLPVAGRCASHPAAGTRTGHFAYLGCRDAATNALDVIIGAPGHSGPVFAGSLGGALTGGVGMAVAADDSSATFFVEGTNGAVYTNTVSSGGVATGWVSMGGAVVGGTRAAPAS